MLPFLREVVLLLVLSVFIAYICYKLRLVPIAGFLLAGVLVGPYALGLVRDVELVDNMAEIGVILLLFTIGIEFSLEKLSRIGGLIFGTGGIQVGVTILLVTVLLAAFGVEWQMGVFTGCLVALSSTAIVLGLLDERAETDSPSGRLSLAILIFQDLAIIAMVLLIPLLAGTGSTMGAMIWALATALALIAAVLVLARKLVPWLLERMAHTRRRELFLLAVVAICFGTAWITSLVGVSLALGAFLAGLVVSESHYSEFALSEILPLRTIFNAIFFVSVGMLLDVRFVLENPMLVGVAVVGVLILKVTITTGSVLVLGFPIRIAATVGLTLAQIGEFSFVLDRAGRLVGLSPAGLGMAGDQTFIASTVLLMLVTPFLVQSGPKLGLRLEQMLPARAKRRIEPISVEPAQKLEDHVVIVGYGPAGRRLVRVLKDTGIPFVVIDLNPRSVKEADAAGLQILYGDASRIPVLEQARITHAKVCVVAINDRFATERVVQVARYLNPTLQVIVRTRFMAEIEPLQRSGADIVVPEELETSVRIFSHVLGAYMISAEEISRQVNLIRSADYNVLRGSIQEAHMMVLQGLDEEGLHTRAVAVRQKAPVAGKTLAELELRNRYGLTVLAVRRDRRTIGSPAGDFNVEPGDRLVLIGTAAQFENCAFLFRDPLPPLSVPPTADGL
jgi:monovalent cation:H+ antiporter-2, CPA2 family